MKLLTLGVLLSIAVTLSLCLPVDKLLKKKIFKGIDFSDVDDVISDKLKKKFGEFAKQGLGKDEKELTNIRKKLKIIDKIAKARGITTKHSNVNGTNTDVEEILYGGDMLLTENQLDTIIKDASESLGLDNEALKTLGVDAREKRQAMREPDSTPLSNNRWEMPIAFAFDANISDITKTLFREAVKALENQTCLTFTFDENSSVTPRIQVKSINSTTCFSSVGYTVGGQNRMNIGACVDSYGTIAHELFHALGVYHHHERWDRDEYINNSADLAINTTHSFNYGTTYDYGSVLHYGGSIVTYKDPLYQKTIGNRMGPTFQDMSLMNSRYRCQCTSPTVTCVNGGYPNPADCTKCNCPGGWGGATCSTVNPGTPNNGASHTSGTFNANTTDDCRIFTFTIGTPNDDSTNLLSKKAWYHIKAPDGYRAQLFIHEANAPTSYASGCPYYGVEMKIKNFNRTGYLICANNPDFISPDFHTVKRFTTEGNRAMIQLYSRRNQARLKVAFRYVTDTNEATIPDTCRPPVNCIDNHTSCAYWAGNGECTNTPGYMRKNCAASCNIQNCVCNNIDSDTKCENWKNGGECEADFPYMSRKCKKSCGLCGSNAFAQ